MSENVTNSAPQPSVPKAAPAAAGHEIIDPAPGHGWWSLAYYGIPLLITIGLAYYLRQFADSPVASLTFKWAAIFGIIAFVASMVLAFFHNMYRVNRSDLRAAGRWYSADLSDERNIAAMIGVWFTLVGLSFYFDLFGLDILSQESTAATILNTVLNVLQAPFVVALWLASIVATPGVLLLFGVLAFWSGLRQNAQRNAGEKGLSFQTWLVFAALLGAFFLSLEPYIGGLIPLYY